MSKFHSKLEYVPSKREGFFILTAALIYESNIARTTIIAPRGAETNFVTGRKLLFVRRIVQDKMNEAAVTHDEIYQTGRLPRAMADAVFREAMLVCGVAAWRAWAAWGAVRMFGGQFYKGPQ